MGPNCSSLVHALQLSTMKPSHQQLFGTMIPRIHFSRILHYWMQWGNHSNMCQKTLLESFRRFNFCKAANESSCIWSRKHRLKASKSSEQNKKNKERFTCVRTSNPMILPAKTSSPGWICMWIHFQMPKSLLAPESLLVQHNLSRSFKSCSKNSTWTQTLGA